MVCSKDLFEGLSEGDELPEEVFASYIGSLFTDPSAEEVDVLMSHPCVIQSMNNINRLFLFQGERNCQLFEVPFQLLVRRKCQSNMGQLCPSCNKTCFGISDR